MTAVDVDALDKLREAATPGEWVADAKGWIDAGRYDTVIGRGDVDCMAHCYGGTSTIEGDNLAADGALIVAAVNALPDLLAEVRRGRALREAVEGLAERWAEMARDHDEQGASNTAMVYRAHARSLTAVLAAVDGAGQ